MTITPSRIIGPALLSNAAATKYTAAAKTKIKRIIIGNPSGGAVTVTMTIGVDAAATRFLDAVSIPAGLGLDIYGPITLEIGEIIQAFASSNNILNILVDAELIT